jgi:hypothetical protein
VLGALCKPLISILPWVFLPVAIGTAAAQGMVDLSGREIPAARADSTRHVLARPWYENLDISGYGAAGYLATGPHGARPNGGFQVRVASLFLRAYAWEKTSVFMEIQASPAGKAPQSAVRTSEVYAQFDHLLVRHGDNALGLRVGRFAIPFGEEYGRIRVGENPLVLNTIPYPWGFDEGLLLYGQLGGLRWITSVTDGAETRGLDDDPSKSFNVQFGGRPLGALDLSASLMTCGRVSDSAMYVGGSSFGPVGHELPSSAGKSPSTKVSPRLYQIDASYDLGKFARGGQILGFFGQAFQDDADPRFDRTLTWFCVEPRLQITRSVYAIGRYSEIGTYDPAAGFAFDGGASAAGLETRGFDTKRSSRASLGLGWKPNPDLLLKFEVAQDRVELIDRSHAAAGSGGRGAYGSELVLHF